MPPPRLRGQSSRARLACATRSTRCPARWTDPRCATHTGAGPPASGPGSVDLDVPANSWGFDPIPSRSHDVIVRVTCDQERPTMGLFRRKPKEPEQQPCPRCTQLLDRNALECPMCGLDLRELYVPQSDPRPDLA